MNPTDPPTPTSWRDNRVSIAALATSADKTAQFSGVTRQLGDVEDK
jgi:hypothetical protein